MFYQNGRYVNAPKFNNNEWVCIGIVFPEQIDFSEYSGGISIYGGYLINNISYYLAEGLGIAGDIVTRSWDNVLKADGTVPAGVTWSYWSGSDWGQVYVLEQSSTYGITPADIYNAYVGTNGSVIDDSHGVTLHESQAQIFSNASWSTYTGKPA